MNKLSASSFPTGYSTKKVYKNYDGTAKCVRSNVETKMASSAISCLSPISGSCCYAQKIRINFKTNFQTGFSKIFSIC